MFVFFQVTSASNCTDYQSYRLKMKYLSPNKEPNTVKIRKYVHTVKKRRVIIIPILISDIC